VLVLPLSRFLNVVFRHADKITGSGCFMYRVSIKSFPDYKRLLQENYVEYKHFFYVSQLEVFFRN
jgi:hypothetical protein